MTANKRYTLFLFQLPIMLLVGILLSFAYSTQVDEQPGIDWLVAIVLALVMDVGVTLLNRRDEKRHPYRN